MMISNVIANGLLLLGAFFILSGAIGAIRMPDFYTRTHALGVADVCGVPLFLIGLICKIGYDPHSFKLVLLIILIIIGSPTGTYILTHTAYRNKVKPIGKSFVPDEVQNAE